MKDVIAKQAFDICKRHEKAIKRELALGRVLDATKANGDGGKK